MEGWALKLRNVSQYLLVQPPGDQPRRYLREMKRLECIFISVRWLGVPIVFLMAWLHEPISETAMWWMGVGLGLFNVIACFLNVRIKGIASQQTLGIISLIVDILFAWGIISLFAHEFYTAAYAGFVYIILEASIRFGLAGSLGMALLFILGLYGAFLYREAAFGIRFSISGYVFWTSLMSMVAVLVGMIVHEGRRQRRQGEIYLKENTLLSERHRIARELHDTVLKTLQGLSLEARALGNRTSATAASVKETADYIEEICSRTSREIREVILALRSDSATEGIASSLSKMLDEWSKATSISGEFTLSGKDIVLPPEPARQLRNVVSEALTNIQRHASASRVQITMKVYPKTLDIEISDNGHGVGRGMDELHTYVAEGKLGIAGMKERVESLGGRFLLNSDRNGTRIGISIPVFRYRSKSKQTNHEPDNDSHS
mgnify:CR=1 FL=1